MLNYGALKQTIVTAIEATYYVRPRSPGLSFAELIEVGKHVDLEQGEVTMAIGYCGNDVENRSGFFVLAGDRLDVGGLADFCLGNEPWPRSVAAFQFVFETCRKLVRQFGRAEIERDVLIAQAQAASIDAHDVDVAISLLVLAGRLREVSGLLHHSPQMGGWASPQEQHESERRQQPRPELRRLLPLVRDVVSRRMDGRAAASDPLDAFSRALRQLGQDRFELWWERTKGELQRASPLNAPTTVIVLSAALAEGALALSVKLALERGTTMQKNLPDDPRQWKFQRLLDCAKSGAAPILADLREADRCARLNDTRQRIHVGNLLATNPTGPVPDAKPEEASDALATVKLLVRRVLDWIEVDARKAAATSPAP